MEEKWIDERASMQTQTNIHTNILTHRQTDGLAHIQRERQTNEQTYKQMERMSENE